MSARTPGSIPAGGLQIVTGTAKYIISARGPIGANQFTDGHEIINTTDFDNSVGWPSADIEISLNMDGTPDPAGSVLELYMRSISAAGIYGADEPVPSQTAMDGFIGSRELSGSNLQTFYFQRIALPACNLRFSVRANTAIPVIAARIMPRSTRAKK